MQAIQSGRLVGGRTSVRFAMLLLLLAGLWVAVDYRLSAPGFRLYDRLYARPIVMDLDTLGRESRQGILHTYSQLHFTCGAEHGVLGDAVCRAALSSFNGIDARVVDFFFRNDRLSAVRISFAGKSLPLVLAQLRERFGPEARLGSRTAAPGNRVAGWARPGGVIAVTDHAAGNGAPIVLWTSGEAMPDRAMRR